MLTEKDYCDYDTCVALKELGFREKCLTYYDTEDNVGLLYNTQWALDNTPYQFTDCLESHNADEGNSYVDAPTLWEAQKWLREEKGMNVNIRAFIENGWYYTIQDCKGNPICSQLTLTEKLYSTYEEALSKGLRQAIKILKGC